MFLTKAQVKAASRALDLARQHPERRHHCAAPRTDPHGQTSRTITATARRNGSRRPPITLTHGAHDADFLQVDPETLEIRCGACAGDLDATVRAEDAAQ